MKTAISIPDDVFNKAEYLARKQGLNRSEFYVKAIRAFIDSSSDNVTEMLNKVHGKGDAFDADVEHGALSDLPAEKW